MKGHKNPLGFLHILSKLGAVSKSNANFACSYKDSLIDPLEFAKVWIGCPGPSTVNDKEETTKRGPILFSPGTSLEFMLSAALVTHWLQSESGEEQINLD